MFEDGAVEFLDMSKEDWEFVTLWSSLEVIIMIYGAHFLPSSHTHAQMINGEVTGIYIYVCMYRHWSRSYIYII